MSQPARTSTTSNPEAFHPDALSAIAALAAGSGAGDDQPAWHERALCAQTDPEAFFPENGASTRNAKQICSRCPVRAECLEDALRRDERFGVWGATSETERRVLRRARPAAAGPAPATAEPAVAEQRTNRGGRGRESVPPPGRRAGSEMAGTLPTEPRGRRDQPGRPVSTFPARARSGPENSGRTPAPATRPPATRRCARGPRQRPAGRAERAEHTTPAATPTPSMSTDRTSDATDDAGAGAAPGEDAAAAAAPDPTPGHDHEQDSRRELRDVARLVLTGQHACSGEVGVGLDGVDLRRIVALVAALTDGPVAGTVPLAGPRLWERRIAAVTAVLSGALTRGKTARAMGEPSQDVAHWVRRHLEAIPLLDSDEQDEEADADGGVPPRAGQR